MMINGLIIPSELEVDLRSGGRKLNASEVVNFKRLLDKSESPLPELFADEQIAKENKLWESESAKFYLGNRREGILPGDIDPKRVLIIGSAEPDSPLALDYRANEPRVVYFGDVEHESYWIEIASSYKAFIEKLANK